MSSESKDEKPETLMGKKKKPVRKRQRLCGDKICQVCGDKASAHHFGTLACETCKAFFRRNALLKDQRKCLFKNDCNINIRTRRFCPACRLLKCFNVGMRADLILDEEEKKERMQRMMERKSRKEQCTHEPSFGHSKNLQTTHSPGAAHLETSSSSEQCTHEPSFGHSKNVQATHSPGAAHLETSSSSEQCTHEPSFGHSKNVQTTHSPGAAHLETPSSSEQCTSVMGKAWHTASEMNTSEIKMTKSPCPYSMDNRCSQQVPLYSHQNTEAGLPGTGNLTAGHDSQLTFSEQEKNVQLPPGNVSYPPSPATAASGWVWMSPVSTHTPSSTNAEDDTRIMSTLKSLAAQYCYINEFQHVPRDALSSDPFMYWRLTQEEQCLLTQLSTAYQDTMLSLLKSSPPREFISNSLITPEFYWKESEIQIHKAIDFAKRNEDFRMLHIDEQIALLKATTFLTIGIQECALYIVEKDAWLQEMGFFTHEHSRILAPNNPFEGSYVRFCRNVKNIVKNDATLYAVLHCFALFDPSSEHTVDRQLISTVRDKYYTLLRHYLESVYSYKHSEKYLIALLENMAYFNDVSHEGKPLIRKIFPTIHNKLINEIFDLE